jgi:sulfopyruvate decarboxylase TPP-binding subunit
MTRHKQIMTGLDLAGQLMGVCDYFTGVPDGVLKKVFSNVSPYYPAPREDHAMAMAFGAQMVGKKACVFMQNSGVGYIGDVLLGLTTLYKTGVIMVVGCRGEFENEEPQHRQWGYRNTRGILQIYGVSCIDLMEKENVVIRAADLVERLNKPVAILIRRGVIDEN